MNAILQEIGVIGWIFIFGIIGVAIWSVYLALKTKNSYKKLFLDFQKEDMKPKTKNGVAFDIIESFKNEILGYIQKNFINSTKKRTENINTEVIIEKNLGDKILNNESFVEGAAGVCIALGLLGTFLGLSLAIYQTSGILEVSAQSMEKFTTGMKGPIGSMAGAFITSIAGVIASLVINEFSRKMKNEKEKFYNSIEDYLDNNVFAYYYETDLDLANRNLESNMKAVATVVENTMETLAKRMNDLFQDGIDKLVSNINENNMDLTKTVSALTNYTKDLDRLTSSLNHSVENFKQPVDRFRGSIDSFIEISDSFVYKLNDGIEGFAGQLNRAESSFKVLQDSIENNRNEISKISELIGGETIRLKDAYGQLSSIVTNINEESRSNSELIRNQINKLESAYFNFASSIESIKESASEKERESSNHIAKEIGSQMKGIIEELNKELGSSMKEVAISADKLSNSTSELKELVIATNEVVKPR